MLLFACDLWTTEQMKVSEQGPPIDKQNIHLDNVSCRSTAHKNDLLELHVNTCTRLEL